MSDDNFSEIRTLFKGGGAVLIGLVLELGISFFGKLLIARTFGRADYGGLSLGMGTAAIASTLVLLGLNKGVGRYLPRDDDRSARRSVLVSAFRIAVPLSILAGVAVWLLAPFLAADVFGDPSITVVFRIFALAIPLAAVMKLALGAVQGMQDSLPKVLIQNITLPVTRLTGIVVVIVLGAGVAGASYAYLASYAAAAAGGLYYVYARTDLFSFDVPYEGRERELLSFSVPLVLTSVMTIVFSDIDMYMLGAFVGTAPVGDYRVIYPLAQLLTVAINAFGFLFEPVVSELDATGGHDRMGRLYRVVTKWILVATLPLFLLFVAFPRPAIAYTFGGKYAGAAASLTVLSVGFFVHTAFGLNRGTLTSLGHTRLLLVDDTVTAAVNVALNLLLIPEFGLLGAAYATTVSYVLLNCLYSYQVYTRTGVQPFSRAMALPALAGGLAMAGIYAFARAYVAISPLSLAALFSVFLAIYGVAVLRFGIEPEEVRLVLSFEERFGVDLGPLKRIADRFR